MKHGQRRVLQVVQRDFAFEAICIYIIIDIFNSYSTSTAVYYNSKSIMYRYMGQKLASIMEPELRRTETLRSFLKTLLIGNTLY